MAVGDGTLSSLLVRSFGKQQFSWPTYYALIGSSRRIDSSPLFENSASKFVIKSIFPPPLFGDIIHLSVCICRSHCGNVEKKITIISFLSSDFGSDIVLNFENSEKFIYTVPLMLGGKSTNGSSAGSECHRYSKPNATKWACPSAFSLLKPGIAVASPLTLAFCGRGLALRSSGET